MKVCNSFHIKSFPVAKGFSLQYGILLRVYHFKYAPTPEKQEYVSNAAVVSLDAQNNIVGSV
jgi:hypothetical protein